MDLNKSFDLIPIAASVFTLYGGISLVKSLLLTNAEDIASMASTFLGSNKHLEKSLIDQKIDTTVGFVISSVGGLLWLISCFFTWKIDAIAQAIGLNALLILALFTVTKKIRQSQSSKMKTKVRAILYANHLGCYVEPHNIDRADLDKLYNDISVFDLSAFVNPNESKKVQIASILNFVGRSDLSDKINSLKNEKSQ